MKTPVGIRTRSYQHIFRLRATQLNARTGFTSYSVANFRIDDTDGIAQARKTGFRTKRSSIGDILLR